MTGLQTPTERTCRQCGRSEAFDEELGTWQIDGAVGDTHCLHVWDITGEFSV
jgi:hypothetical protein